MNTLINISEICLYLRCLRLVYFENLESMPKKIDAGQILLRSLMLSLFLKNGLEGHLK